MSDIRAGDRVRVEFEGVVDAGPECGQFRVDGASGVGADFAWVLPEHCTVIAPPVKVGDTISGEAAYEALPVGAVLVDTEDDGEVLIRRKYDWASFWADSNIDFKGEVAARRRLVYLPGQQ